MSAVVAACPVVPSMGRLVYICDWLPPDFGAVGQYAMLFSAQWARDGWEVTLVGLTSGTRRHEGVTRLGLGSLEVVRIHRPFYKKQKVVARLIWTVVSNLRLLQGAFAAMRRADAILFTGSPPLMLHFIAPLNVFLRKKLIYRITDFHPECLIAERGHAGPMLGLLLRLTKFWRRRVDQFEVLGFDQVKRLAESGVEVSRISLRRDPSPVKFPRNTQPVPIPTELKGAAGIILYSGNWGVAHDDNTFIQGYSQYLKEAARPLGFWMNASGAKADRVAKELSDRNVPFYRSTLVPLEVVPQLLSTADVHLITLRDPFVGYVLPSKVHACIESGKSILFVGHASSDVHLLANEALPSAKYQRVDVGDVEGLVAALHRIERKITGDRSSR